MLLLASYQFIKYPFFKKNKPGYQMIKETKYNKYLENYKFLVPQRVYVLC